MIEKFKSDNKDINQEDKELIFTPEDFDNFEKSVGSQLIEVNNTLDNGIKKSKEATKKILKIIFTRVLPVYIAYLGSVYFFQKPDGKFSERERAKKEIKIKGITSEQESTYKFGMSEMLYRGISPLLYAENDPFVYLKLIPNVIIGRDNTVTMNKGWVDSEYKAIINAPASEDAWSLYLGLPQKNNTFGISDYKPSESKEDKYYFKINGFSTAFKDFLSKSKFEGKSIQEKVLSYANDLKNKGGMKVTDSEIQDESRADSTINHHVSKIDLDLRNDIALMLNSYTMSCGNDEKGDYFSYYDKWDLNVAIEKSGKGIGRAFEIYDRIYYNAQTGEIFDSLISK